MQKYTIHFLFYLCMVLLACFKIKGQCDAEQRCLYLSKKLTNHPKYVTLTLEGFCKLPHPTNFSNERKCRGRIWGSQKRSNRPNTGVGFNSWKQYANIAPRSRFSCWYRPFHYKVLSLWFFLKNCMPFAKFPASSVDSAWNFGCEGPWFNPHHRRWIKTSIFYK